MIDMSKPNLQQQIETLLNGGADDSQIHRWLCHPGQECTDGCNCNPIVERLAAFSVAYCPEERDAE